MKDKTNRITLQLDDEMFDFIKYNAISMDMSSPELLRMIIRTVMRLEGHVDLRILEKMSEKDKTDSDLIIYYY